MKKLLLLLLLCESVSAQQVVVEATTNQMAVGTATLPFVVTPRMAKYLIGLSNAATSGGTNIFYVTNSTRAMAFGGVPNSTWLMSWSTNAFSSVLGGIGSADGVLQLRDAAGAVLTITANGINGGISASNLFVTNGITASSATLSGVLTVGTSIFGGASAGINLDPGSTAIGQAVLLKYNAGGQRFNTRTTLSANHDFFSGFAPASGSATFYSYLFETDTATPSSTAHTALQVVNKQTATAGQYLLRAGVGGVGLVNAGSYSNKWDVSETGNVTLAGSTTSTNGTVSYNGATFPTNSVPISATGAGNTNYWTGTWKGFYRMVFTNYAGAAGTFCEQVPANGGGWTVQVFIP